MEYSVDFFDNIFSDSKKFKLPTEYTYIPGTSDLRKKIFKFYTLRPIPLVRQYNNIYCSENDYLPLRNGDIRVINILTSGSGSSKWFLYVSKDKKLWKVYCNISYVNDEEIINGWTFIQTTFKTIEEELFGYELLNTDDFSNQIETISVNQWMLLRAEINYYYHLKHNNINLPVDCH